MEIFSAADRLKARLLGGEANNSQPCLSCHRQSAHTTPEHAHVPTTQIHTYRRQQVPASNARFKTSLPQVSKAPFLPNTPPPDLALPPRPPHPSTSTWPPPTHLTGTSSPSPSPSRLRVQSTSDLTGARSFASPYVSSSDLQLLCGAPDPPSPTQVSSVQASLRTCAVAAKPQGSQPNNTRAVVPHRPSERQGPGFAR